MANRNRSRAIGRPKKNLVWAALRIELAMTTTVSAQRLVQDSDWVAIGGQPSCTIIAVRGWLAFRAAGVNTAQAKWYIGTADEDITSIPSPDAISTYVDEDIMFTDGLDKAAGAVDGQGMLHHSVINVKAKRRIKSGKELQLVMRASVNTEIAVSGVIRTLLLLNNG